MHAFRKEYRAFGDPVSHVILHPYSIHIQTLPSAMLDYPPKERIWAGNFYLFRPVFPRLNFDPITPMSLKHLLFFVLTAIACRYAAAQSSNFTVDHTQHLERLGNAKDSLYQNILDQYKDFIWRYPKDPHARVERCRFIQTAYYDDYEEYNPNAEAAEACARELLNVFVKEPEVLLYPSEFLYGDTAIAYLKTLTREIDSNPALWKNDSWKVYNQLAEQYDNTDGHRDALFYAARAMASNDTLDLSLLQARAYKGIKQIDSAVAVLANHLDSTDMGWILNQKGRMLLDLGAPARAIEAFRLAARDTSTHQDLAALAQAMIDNGLHDEARAYLLQDYKQNQWKTTERAQKLLEYDLSHGSADSAAFSYKRFVADQFMNDPLGVYRLELFIRSPGAGWSLADAGRILLLFGTIALVFIIPYVWVLPIHYIGAIRRARGKLAPETSFHWGLRHFWVACSMLLLCDLLSILLFDYSGFLSNFSEEIVSQHTSPINKASADMMLFFSTISFIYTVALIDPEDIRMFFSRVRYNLGLIRRQVGLGIALAFLLRIGLVFYQTILGAFSISLNEEASTVMASVVDNIVSINRFYNPVLGFMFVVLLVPFYEEVLFRGIFLSSCQRNIPFIWANIAQSLTFAILHQKLMLIPFYFAFGMVAGHFARKTQSLTAGVALHVTNNLLAFLAILYLQR
ncbi:CPBP family intramembrane metalloprotease [Chryseolinea soli]|uniref:CPBP family intramembrane metalloprotease n=1 Tax=Chryseolinea soli TaxID=2321403 RepID=A0A385SR58_9BACT|nr:CPBP family intramembrane metalloprotease [Chryseolinea soli]